MELPAIGQLCRLYMSRESTSPVYAKEGMIEAFLVSIEGVAPDVVPPACFPCFCVSLWPILRFGVRVCLLFALARSKCNA